MVFSRGPSASSEPFDFGLTPHDHDSHGFEPGPTFSGALRVARILDPSEASSGVGDRLAEALDSGRARNLEDAFRQLNPSEQQALRARWGRSLDELLSLAGERDERLFHQGLLHIAERLEDGENLENLGLAEALYAAAQEEGSHSLSLALATRARLRVDAIHGVGDSWRRAAFQARHMASAVTEISPLFAMSVAGPVFRLTRLLTLGRLTSSPLLGAMTRPFAAQALAYLAGFGAEVLSFSAAGRLADAALGHEAHASLGEELASGAIFLGCLKLAGGLGQGALRFLAPAERAVEPGAAGVLAQFLVPHVATLGGILTSHRIESAFGLREAAVGETSLVDAFALMFQLNASGRLTHSIMGPGFHGFERRLERDTLGLSRGAEIEARNSTSWLESLTPDLATPEGWRMSAAELPEAPAAISSEISGESLQLRPVRATRGGEPPVPPPPSDRGGSGGEPPPSDPELEAVRLRARRYRVRLALDDFRHADRVADAAFAETALEVLRSEPDLAREELIGRDFEFLTPQRWNQLHDSVFRVPGFEAHTRPELRRVLIANRGEIALRLARSLVREGIKPYFTVATAESESGWVREMTRMGAIGVPMRGERPQDTYLNISRVVSAARRMHVDAIHPGYGYLSENVAFRQAVEGEGLVFLGPSVETMRLAGDKDAFKRSARAAGVPVVPGTERGYAEAEGLLSELTDLGLIVEGELRAPIRLKAVGGGGGRGQATVRSLAELRRVFPRLSTESQGAFGDGRIMAELAMERFQHLEFQILGDRFGNIIHLGERECTAQERNQKLLEFHPAEIFDRFAGLRERMADAAVRAARAVNYTGHGTVEFLLNPDSGEFFAMEVNARIQVEHRVTEAVTGVDLVAEQLRLGRGLPLRIRQAELQLHGAAIEIRVKAVDSTRRDREGNPVALPEAGGVVTNFEFPAEPGVSIEQSVFSGDRISPNADPMIAKVIVTGADRATAVSRAIGVLERARIEGRGPDGSRPLRTDLERQLRLLRTRAVREASYDNNFVDAWMRAGVEDQTQFPVRFTLPLRANLPAPVYLEVVGDRVVAEAQAEGFERALAGVLRSRRADTSALRGTLADFLREQPRILGRGRVRRGSNLRLQARSTVDGELRHLLSYEGARLDQIWLPTRLPTGDGAWLEGVYHLRFSRNGAAPEAEFYRREAAEDFELWAAGRPVASGNGVTREFQLFPEARHRLHVKLRQTGAATAVSVRDADRNVLLRSNSMEVTEELGVRVLGLIEYLRTDIGEGRRSEIQGELNETLRALATLPSEHPNRQAAVEFLGGTTQSVVMELSAVADGSHDPRVHALTDEIIARRELQRHEFVSYTPLDAQSSVVRFVETRASGERVPRVMIRSLLPLRDASPHLLFLDYRDTLEQAQRHLRDALQAGEGEDNVIQVWVRRRRFAQPSLNPEFLTQSLRTALGESSEDHRSPDLQGVELRLKRVTFGVFGGGEYPYYYTFRRAHAETGRREGVFEEDLRYRGIHPQVANALLEMPRLDQFEVERDALSDRFMHLYYARNRAARDFRLFGMGIVPHSEVIARSRSAIEIPALEEALSRMAATMESSLQARPETGRPVWNRLFLNVLPTLAVTEGDFLHYLEGVLNGRWERQIVDGRSRRVLRGGLLENLSALSLEKVGLRARLRDTRLPAGYRNVLVRLANPTGYHYEGQIHTIVRAPVREADGTIREREVLLGTRVFQRWLRERGRPDFVLEANEFQPADIPIRPSTPEEIREARARTRGAVWAYRIPGLLSDVAEGFSIDYGLASPRTPRRRGGPSLPENGFVELDLVPGSTRINAQTGLMDPNYGELAPAYEGREPRPPGRNRAGVVIGEHSVDLGLVDETGSPLHVRRMLIIGDLTHEPSKGSLSEEECGRLNAAIRYAQRHRIPIDWFVASSGAQITREKGVENLDATASTFREIVLSAVENSRGGEPPVPINFVVMDHSIGAMSYYVAVGAIAEQTRGTVIMVSPPAGAEGLASGSMGLTGDVAMTANFRPTLTFSRLRQEAERLYPLGNRSIAGYERIHGPNGEAMAVAPDLRSAVELLMGYHYFTYSPNGELASPRSRGLTDPVARDITTDVSALGRSIAEEIEALRVGRKHDPASILEALRDRGSPDPLVLWREDFNLGELSETIRRQLPLRLPKAFVAFSQMGGHPVQFVYLAQAISPADAERMARAIQLVDERVPLLFMGSWPGFWSDPESMAGRQLRKGGALGAAMARRRGPTLVVNLQYSVGGAKVVVSKNLRTSEERDQHRVIALSGAREQVIGGASVENVIGVYAKENLATARATPEVRAAEASLRAALGPEAREAAQRAYDEILDRSLWRIIGERGRAFDERHSVARALRMGSIDRIIEPSELRPAIIEELGIAVAAYRAWRERRERRAREAHVVELAHAEDHDLAADLIRGLVQVGGTEEARERARTLARGLLEFAGAREPESGSGAGGEPGIVVAGSSELASASRSALEREGEPP